MLVPLFASHIKADTAYIIIQRLVGSDPLDVLVECIREQLNCKTVVAGHTLDLRGGTLHFLPNERNYALRGNRLIAVDLPGNTRLNLDHLFSSLLDISNPCAIVVLSGMLIDSDGIAGLTKAHAQGITIAGSLEAHTPVFDMVDQLQKAGLMGELYAPKQLLEKLPYSTQALKLKVRRDGVLGPPRILIADDDQKIRGELTDLLRHHGMTTDFAIDGLDAMRKLQKCKYDALLLDLHLSEIDGLKILEALKTMDPDLAIILLTSLDETAKVQAAKGYKIQGCLQKPYNWEKLKKLLPNPCLDPAAI